MQKKSKFSHFERKPVIYAIICFFLIAVTPFLVFGQVSHSVSFERSELIITSEIAEDGITYSKVSITGLPQTDEVGKPSLPIKYVKLIVPSEQNVETIVLGNIKKEEITVLYPIFPTQEPIPACIDCPKPAFVPPDPAVYKSDQFYPSEIVKIVHDGYFDGSNHIVTVAVYPLQYQPASGILTFFSSVDFKIKLKSGKTRKIQARSRSVKNQEIYNSILKSIVDNPQDLFMYQTTPTLIESTQKGEMLLGGPVPFYEYVIITDSALESYFDDFVSWKIRKGLDVGVVTVEEISSNYTGDEISGIYDEAGKIRQYLSDAYQSGTVYALLAGDIDIVPIRYGCGGDNTWGEGNSYKIPADLYYADFTGDWDVDSDEYTGEENDDSPDYNPEIFVGRLTCNNGNDINNWTEKVLKYEQNPGNGDRDYLTRGFWVLGYNHTTSEKVDEIISHVPSTFEALAWKQDPPRTGKEVQEEMNNHGLIQWISHGAWDFITVKDTTEDGAYLYTFYTDRVDPYDGILERMTNTDYYSIVYSDACRTASFDAPIICMVDGWLFYESICGPAFLGNTRSGYYGVGASPSEDLSMKFYDLLTQGTEDPDNYGNYLHLGISELISKLNYTAFKHHYLSYSHNLFGCPETQIWTTSPSDFTNMSITDNGTSLAVNANIGGCDICVSSMDDGATYHMVAHNTSSYTFTTSVRPLHITVTKLNYIPCIDIPTNYILKNITVETEETRDYAATNSITVAENSTYFVIEGNGSTGGNVTTEAGDYVSLKPGFHAQNGCEFTATIEPSLKGTLSSFPTRNLTLDAALKPGKAGENTSNTSSEETKELIPSVFSCSQNSPNPFNVNTTIKYGLPKDSDVSLCIYNLAGQKIQTLVDANESAGYKSVSWDGRTSSGTIVPQGIYFYKFQAGNEFKKTYKMIVVR